MVFLPTGNPAPDYYRPAEPDLDHFGSADELVRGSGGLLATLAGRPNGAVVPPGDQELRVRVVAEAPIERVDLVRSGRVTSRGAQEGAREARVEWRLEGLRPGEAPYVRVVQRDGGAAWSSPFFFE